jgi:hypothetical protein
MGHFARARSIPPPPARGLRGASPQQAYSIGSWARAQAWRHVEANAPQRPGQRPVAEPVPRSTKIDDEIEFGGEPD